MKINDLMNVEDLEKAIADGLISKRKHPIHPIYILNYTAAAQFDWAWNDVTLNCRGLVIDENYNIIARSFPKFFSYEQLNGTLPTGDFVVEEKLDGSMLLVFKYKDEVITATRGSFESEQAIKAKEFLPELFDLYFIPDTTYIFEVIYKENRIVVDYDFEGLVLLAEYDTKLDLWDDDLDSDVETFGFRRPKVYSFNSLDDILKCNESNIEGFVLRYSNGQRVKIKTEDYKRLHRLVTGVSEKTVWEALRDNKFSELIDNVPDEFYNWVEEVKKDLESTYFGIEYQCKRDFDRIKHYETRKDFAIPAMRSRYSQVLFQMLDNKDYSQTIWKIVKPEVTKVFKMVREDSN